MTDMTNVAMLAARQGIRNAIGTFVAEGSGTIDEALKGALTGLVECAIERKGVTATAAWLEASAAIVRRTGAAND